MRILNLFVSTLLVMRCSMSLAMLRQASGSSLYAYLEPSSEYEMIAPESHSSMLRDNVFGVIVV